MAATTEGPTTQPLTLPEELILMLLNEENGYWIERFAHRAESVIDHDVETLEEARAAIGAFTERYNNGWHRQRHGYMTPGPRPREAQPQGGLMFRPSPCPENRVRYSWDFADAHEHTAISVRGVRFRRGQACIVGPRLKLLDSIGSPAQVLLWHPSESWPRRRRGSI